MKFKEAVKIGMGLYLGKFIIDVMTVTVGKLITDKKTSEKSETSKEEETE